MHCWNAIQKHSKIVMNIYMMTSDSISNCHKSCSDRSTKMPNVSVVRSISGSQYLICPLPGELIVVCKKIGASVRQNHGCVEFMTLDEICQDFRFCSAGVANVHSRLKQQMRSIEKYFDKDRTKFESQAFRGTLIPCYDNIELDQGFRSQIGSYLGCANGNDNNINPKSTKMKKGDHPLKKRLIQSIPIILKIYCASPKDIIEYIRDQAGQFFQTKYQINANRCGGLAIEIVLFCKLANVIVGIPIKLNGRRTKWIVKSILVQEMKHNTMLPQLLLDNNSLYVHSIWNEL